MATLGRRGVLPRGARGANGRAYMIGVKNDGAPYWVP